jgi:hypothetical protein
MSNSQEEERGAGEGTGQADANSLDACFPNFAAAVLGQRWEGVFLGAIADDFHGAIEGGGAGQR